jgi:hypothetical protein
MYDPENRLVAQHKEYAMKISTVWKGRKTGKKKNRAVLKPKIRWQLLGLTDPKLTEQSSSIETIRREVSSLASSGFGPATRSRVTAQESKSQGRNNRPAESRPRRRGATE